MAQSSKTTLYRIYGENRTLLYVGISDQYDLRMRQHAEKAWWREVRAIDTEEFGSRTEAKAAETAAIRTEGPRYNRAENGSDMLRTRPAVRPNSTGKRTMVSLEQAADYVGVSTKTVRRYIAAGKLRAYRMGPRLMRVDLADVETLLAPVPTMGDWA